MNHLRELLSAPQRLYPRPMTEREAAWAEERLKALGEEAMCFFMWDKDDTPDLNIVRELCRMPFNTCWFEMTFRRPDGNEVYGALVHSRHQRSEMSIWARTQARWQFVCSTINHHSDFFTNSVDVYHVFPELRHDPEWDFFWAMHSEVSVFLTALNCTNVQTVEHRPREALQRARAKRGKKPLFSYHTLELQLGRTNGESLGGTHASPRLHLRRGHPREYAPGKYVWVQPHVVGNKALGMIHKDYDGSRLAERRSA